MPATFCGSSRNMRHWQMFTQSGMDAASYSLISSLSTCDTPCSMACELLAFLYFPPVQIFQEQKQNRGDTTQ